jgi:hypothetical protein
VNLIISCLSNKNTSTTDSLNLFFSALREEASLNNAGNSGEFTLTKNLSETGLKSINDSDSSFLAGSASFFRSQRPELVQVEDGAVSALLGQVEATHTDLTEVTGMVSVQIGTMMVQTTGHTTTTRMLTVLSDTTVTGRNVSSLLTILTETSRLLEEIRQ